MRGGGRERGGCRRRRRSPGRGPGWGRSRCGRCLLRCARRWPARRVLGRSTGPGGWAVDGTTFDVPDSVANADYFGRPGSPRGEGAGAFPQVRVAGLGECGTHAIFAAEMGPLAVHETELARRLLGHLRAGMLLIADRGFAGFDLWRAAASTGADLLWRVRNSAVLPVVEQLADGSYLSHICAARDRHRHADPATVRVIEYTLAGSATAYRLITTITDPVQAPAPDLAGLYAQRWEFETSLDELKTH